MIVITRYPGIFLLLLFYGYAAKCWNLEETSEKLLQLVDIKSLRIPRDSEQESPIWLEYEFNTGAGNREELFVSDISVHEFANFPDSGTHWQFLEVDSVSYLVYTEKSNLSLQKFDCDNIVIKDTINLNVDGSILAFKLITLSSFPLTRSPLEIDVVAVLCVESESGTSLQWYRLVNGSSFQFFWSWPVQKHVRDVEFIQHENQNKLLLLDDNEMPFGKQYSSIDVYGFSIDFTTNAFHFWLWQRTLVPKVFDIQVCSIYESISLALQGTSDVFLYEYRNTTAGSIFQELQTIKSQDLRNFVCFESGYLQFLAISGPEAGLFHFFEGEFQYNVESESSFDVSDVSWVKDVRLNTYRDESLLLVQLRNTSVIALAWQGTSFKRIQLPTNVLDQYDLSKAIVIPKFGFILGNRFIKFQTGLKNLKHPIQHTTERLLSLQRLLNYSLNHQEEILDETEVRIEKSYVKHPVVTGFWNLSTVNATNASITNDVVYQSVSIGSINLSKDELKTDLNALLEKLENLQQELDEIDTILSNAFDPNSTELNFDSNVEVIGNINVTGNLNVDDLSINFMNDVTVPSEFQSDEANSMIPGGKKFSTIEAEKLTIHSVNGVPLENIRFGNSIVDYRDVDFSNINRIYVEEHLHFSTINDVNWETLMKSIVWKNREAFISGNTTIEGSLMARLVILDTVNNLPYPDDYVLINDYGSTSITGSKSFDNVLAFNLKGINTINDINYDDFVILNKDNVLTEEIVFDNLIVEGPLQIDGEVTGTERKQNQLLNNTNEISSQIIFSNLSVLGNVTFAKSLLKNRILKFNDLLLKTDKNVEITGTKIFHGNVTMKSNVTITSGMINGHSIDDFVTLNTDQKLQNLNKILPNVSFGNVTMGETKNLEDVFQENGNASNCFEKIIVFKSPIIVDELSFDDLNGDVPYETLNQKLKEIFDTVRLENLTVDKLEAEEIIPRAINGYDFANVTKTLESSRVIHEYKVENLETNQLKTKFINGMSLDEINQLKDHVKAIFDEIFNGNVTIESLRVTGKISMKSINGRNVKDLYKDQIGTVIFKEDVSIENLTILQFTNGFNFSERITDIVLKTDRDIKIDGYKTFDVINCNQLEIASLNGHPVENILDPAKEQVLTGPIVVNGFVTVLNDFNITGKIGDVVFNDLMNTFQSLGNNTFKFRGNIQFTSNNISIENLRLKGSIQERNFDDFIKSLIFKNEDNVTISGLKKFENSVTFNNMLEVHDRLNDIDLKRFWEKAIFIDKPFSIKSKIIFTNGIKIEKDLEVKRSLETGSVMGVNLNELKFSVLYLNRPTYVKEPITFTDVTFESNIEIEKFNHLDMTMLIPLHTEQIIPVDVLKCLTVNVDNIEMLGNINEENLQTIQENTFMLYGNQNITGLINFTGNVHIRRNFNANLINNIDPKKIAPLNSKSALTGNFVFEKPIIFNQSLRVLGYLNGINPNRWEAVSVTTNHSFPQIISGKWTVLGNVYFRDGLSGGEMLNGINITELSDTLGQKRLEMDAMLTEANENLESMCDDLRSLKHYAEKQIYKFSAFDYLQIIEFNSSISSVHYFELNDLDYLMISYNTCHMHTYLFTGTNFEMVANVPDFGIVERWTTFNHEKALYFLTSGTESCGRNPVNLWKLKDDEFTHVLDLGHKIDNRRVNEDMFLKIINGNNGRSSWKQVQKELEESISSLADKDNVEIVLEADQMLPTSRKSIYEYGIELSNDTSVERNLRSAEILNFAAGSFQKKMFLYYDDKVSKDHIFIFDNETQQKKILQTIRAHRPSMFTILNFDGSIETLFVFLENKKNLRIYEYKGIQGFVYRDTIRMDVDKLFSFKIRKYQNFAKKYCLALIRNNRLTILEANMYGEKLDMGDLTCSKN